MPSILDTTVGGATANSYADAAFATAYFATRREPGAWRQDSTEQEKLLLAAMKPLEARLRKGAWGIRASSAQRLLFPRKEDASASAFYDVDGLQWASNAIPTPIKEAQCEIALAMADGRYPIGGKAEAVLEKQLPDKTRTEYGAGGSQVMQLPQVVEDLLAPFLALAPTAGSFAVANVANW